MQESLQGSRRVAVAVACVAVAVGALALAGGIAAGRSASPVQRARTPAPITSRYALAGRCIALGLQRYLLQGDRARHVHALRRRRKAARSRPSGLQCNPRGLTALGRFAIEQMIKAHMLIEVDHLSQKARDTVLSIAAKAHYPLISSHNGTGGEWSPAELLKLYKLGGFAAVTPDRGAGARHQDPDDGQVPRPFALLRRRDRHRHGRPVVAARPARRRRAASAALPVQVIRRQGHVHARGHAARARSTSTPTASRTTA